MKTDWNHSKCNWRSLSPQVVTSFSFREQNVGISQENEGRCAPPTPPQIAPPRCRCPFRHSSANVNFNSVLVMSHVLDAPQWRRGGRSPVPPWGRGRVPGPPWGGREEGEGADLGAGRGAVWDVEGHADGSVKVAGQAVLGVKVESEHEHVRLVDV